MNKTLQTLMSSTAAAMLVLAAAPSLAQEATAAPELDHFVASKSRAQVRDEVARAAVEGQRVRTDADIERQAFADFVSMKTRTQVGAETRAAMRLGLIPRNDWEYATLTPNPEQLRLVAEAGQRAKYDLIAGR